MEKFLNYEDRLEIESGLKEHMMFMEMGKVLLTLFFVNVSLMLAAARCIHFKVSD